MTWAGWYRRTVERRRAPAVVLMYHRFTDASPDPWSLGVSAAHFAEHVALLQRAYRPASLAQLAGEVARRRIPRRTVVVTADDGYRDNLHVAAPVLGAQGVPATFFISTGAIDSPGSFWWDELAALILGDHALPADLPLPTGVRWTGASEASEASWTADRPPSTNRDALYLATWQALFRAGPEAQSAAVAALRASIAGSGSRFPTLTGHEVATLARMPFVEIGAHGRTHRPLDHLDGATVAQEVHGSCADLAHLTGRPVHSFAFPHGAHDAGAFAAVRAAGIRVACTTVEGGVHEATTLHALPRIHVRNWSADRLDDVLRWWLGR
ncbi:MAG: polysaccharide deacetylase family protein [Gemmatimonadetes bacterium]|nr:polysaccharide deacetylase family protein [Gemmatimonadota bacterium]